MAWIFITPGHPCLKIDTLIKFEQEKMRVSVSSRTLAFLVILVGSYRIRNDKMTQPRSSSEESSVVEGDLVDELLDQFATDVVSVVDTHTREKGNSLYVKRTRIVFAVSQVRERLRETECRLDKLQELVSVLPMRDLDSRCKGLARTELFMVISEVLRAVALQVKHLEEEFRNEISEEDDNRVVPSAPAMLREESAVEPSSPTRRRPPMPFPITPMDEAPVPRNTRRKGPV